MAETETEKTTRWQHLERQAKQFAKKSFSKQSRKQIALEHYLSKLEEVTLYDD